MNINEKKFKWWSIIGLFGLSVLLYINTYNHGYVLDDAIVIEQNEFTTQGLNGIERLLKYDTFRGFFKEDGKANLVVGGRYRPFTPVMFAIGVEMFGLNPMVGHIGNIFWYSLLVVSLFIVLRQVLQWKNSIASKASLIALLTAILWAAHPVHTEVVANIKGRDEIFVFLASLWAIYFAVKYTQKKKLLYVILSAICFIIALLSKENAISFLGVLPLVLYVYGNIRGKKLLIYTLPLVVSSILFLSIRAKVLSPSINMKAAEIEHIKNQPKDLLNDPFQKVVNNQFVPFSNAEKTATISYTLGKYLSLLVLPITLSHDYYPYAISPVSWANWVAIIALLVHLALLIFGIKLSLKRKTFGFALLFYLGTLFLVSNLIFPIGTFMAERFLFIPSLSWCLILALGFYELYRYYKPIYAIGLVTMVLAAYSYTTIQRNKDWKDNYTLFTTDVNKYPGSAKLQNAAGAELINKGSQLPQGAQRQKLLNQGLQHTLKATQIHPGFKNAFLISANGYLYLENYAQALTYYDYALTSDPNYQEAISNKAIALREAGRFYGETKGQIQKSLSYLMQAEQINPTDFQTQRLLGVAYGQAGQAQKAITHFQKATKIEPDNARAWYDLGTAHHFLGDEESRKKYHQKALSMNPQLLQQ